MAYTLNSKNFESLKETFKKETNLDPSTDMAIYVSYYQAKMLDTQTQLLGFVLQEMIISSQKR